MPNNNLKDKLYDTGDGKKETYTTLAMRESRLNKAKKHGDETGDFSEFNRLGGDKELKKLESIIHSAQKDDHTIKKNAMNSGRENQFKKKHTKDKDNSNPTGIGATPKLHVGNMKDKILNNKEVYNENYIKELKTIQYLIEYLAKK